MSFKSNRPHEKLDVWQESMDLVVQIYRFTSTFPRHEKYGLTSQMQKASASIPSNIAEGAARNGSREFIHFLSIARASLAELETQIQIAQRIGYVENTDNILKCCNSLFIKLSTLMNKVKSKSAEMV